MECLVSGRRNVEDGHLLRAVFSGMLHMPCQHLLTEQLVKRLPKKLFDLEIQIRAQGTVRRECFINITSSTRRVPLRIQRRSIRLRVLPFD
jgi:hypothetical protein